MRKPFAPVPIGVACPDIYGGPQTALVTGTFRGRGVHATFNRHDGCEIARWDAVRFLFPAGPVQSAPLAVPISGRTGSARASV